VSWYIAVPKKCAVFTGRARRREYWTFVLFNVIITVVLTMIESIADSDSEGSQSTLATLYGLVVLTPSLAVGVRRLHDIGKSGWWMLIGLIPIIGTIVLLIFAVRDSQPADNQYGQNPKREIPPQQEYSANQP